MLLLPKKGVSLSTNSHNGRLDIQADWVEASALFASDSVSRSDVVDALIESSTYQNQDFANEWVTNIFSELERRIDLLGDFGALARNQDNIHRRGSGTWRDRPAYAFCMALSVLPLYRKEVDAALGKDSTEQGELFEKLCAESFAAMNWDVELLGWSKGASKSLASKISALASVLGEPVQTGALKRWTKPNAKDAGLDLVAWNGFADKRGGRPICLVQCASGENWKEKIHTPDLDTWKKLIDFTTKPRRGLAMPFAPEADEFRRESNRDSVMFLLDRHRILTPRHKGAGSIPSSLLAKDLVKWTKAREALFPRDDA